MITWPRSIKPEDRIRYLIEARHEFKNTAEWRREDDGALVCFTMEGELLTVDFADESYEAYYTFGSDTEDGTTLVGEFGDPKEAQKALIDHTVVIWASRQAWEDVAT